MYILLTFLLIILVPAFLALITIGNIKENMKTIGLVATLLGLVLGYLYIPRQLPISGRVMEAAYIYYDNRTSDILYQESIQLLPKDKAAMAMLLKKQKFYPLMDDQAYSWGHSVDFSIMDAASHKRYWLNINDNDRSTLSYDNRSYYFTATKDLLTVAEDLSQNYASIMETNTTVDALTTTLSLSDHFDDTFVFNLELASQDPSIQVSEINIYSNYNNDSQGLHYLLDRSPISNYKDQFEVSLAVGKEGHIKELQECQLIIRGQETKDGHIKPFQQLTDLKSYILDH